MTTIKTLSTIVNSPRATKKFRAQWSDLTHTDFGASGYSDYTIHHDKRRRELYRLRHQRDHINDPYKAGALSWYILWGESIDFAQNVKSFKRLFNL